MRRQMDRKKDRAIDREWGKKETEGWEVTRAHLKGNRVNMHRWCS